MTSGYQSHYTTPLERYESKFVIPTHMIDPVSDFASIYCSLDKYSKQSKDTFYRVNNLYFDSPDYLFLKRRLANCENRFNMRIRSYSDTSPLPCFLEIKQRKDNGIKKIRAMVVEKDWHRMFDDPDYEWVGEDDSPSISASNRSLFLKLSCEYNATPKVLTQYRRRAFQSDVDGYARVTLDVDLRYRPEEDYNLVPGNGRMVPYDNSTIFDPGCSVILELKCYSKYVPLWMIDLIRHFDLRRRSFSKYVTGIAGVLDLHSYDTSFRQTPLTS
jgi:hypothetical protein